MFSNALETKTKTNIGARNYDGFDEKNIGIDNINNRLLQRFF